MNQASKGASSVADGVCISGGDRGGRGGCVKGQGLGGRDRLLKRKKKDPKVVVVDLGGETESNQQQGVCAWSNSRE